MHSAISCLKCFGNLQWAPWGLCPGAGLPGSTAVPPRLAGRTRAAAVLCLSVNTFRRTWSTSMSYTQVDVDCVLPSGSRSCRANRQSPWTVLQFSRRVGILVTKDRLIWDPTHGRAGEGTGGEGGNQTNAAERTGEDKAYAKHWFLGANVFFPLCLCHLFWMTVHFMLHKGAQNRSYFKW